MDLKDFIEKFAEQFEETEISSFSANTSFKELEEWSSLMSLAIIAMVDEEYGVRVKGDDIKDAVFLYRGLAEVSGGDAIKNATLTVTDGKKLCKYIDLSYDGEPIDYPGRGEAAINYNLARQLGGIEVGDEIKLTTSEKKELTVTVSALFDNYVDIEIPL